MEEGVQGASAESPRRSSHCLHSCGVCLGSLLLPPWTWSPLWTRAQAPSPSLPPPLRVAAELTRLTFVTAGSPRPPCLLIKPSGSPPHLCTGLCVCAGALTPGSCFSLAFPDTSPRKGLGSQVFMPSPTRVLCPVPVAPCSWRWGRCPLKHTFLQRVFQNNSHLSPKPLVCCLLQTGAGTLYMSQWHTADAGGRTGPQKAAW